MSHCTWKTFYCYYLVTWIIVGLVKKLFRKCSYHLNFPLNLPFPVLPVQLSSPQIFFPSCPRLGCTWVLHILCHCHILHSPDLLSSWTLVQALVSRPTWGRHLLAFLSLYPCIGCRRPQILIWFWSSGSGCVVQLCLLHSQCLLVLVWRCWCLSSSDSVNICWTSARVVAWIDVCWPHCCRSSHLICFDYAACWSSSCCLRLSEIYLINPIIMMIWCTDTLRRKYYPVCVYSTLYNLGSQILKNLVLPIWGYWLGLYCFHQLSYKFKLSHILVHSFSKE